MEILRSWLNDYIETEKSDEELSDLLTFSGTLVDELKKGIDEKVIVAKIKSIKKHPDADKLRLATVDTGTEGLEIVCGAPNIEEGQLVPLAQVGTHLGDFEIKEAVIRGIQSKGMLCSEKELGVSDSHEGIMILPENYEIGKPINEYIGGDAVYEIEVTPNRGDCLSHIGVARELSALLDTKLKYEPTKISAPGKDLKIEIKNPNLCFQYHGAIIEGVKIGPSPEWLQARLRAMGASPINNVVDITNYIMLDLGQPLHAFDRKKVPDDTIVVRAAEEGEVFVTLDGENRSLSKDMLVIADKEKPIALAGVMGGLDSEISDDTADIILESAEFERRSIRKTAKTTGLQTEASYRFERGVDPVMTKEALGKAAKMICEIAGGKVTNISQATGDTYQNDWIDIEYSKINDLLGTDISEKEIDGILEKLGFAIKDGKCQAPTWRHDVEIWQDLAEEIGRIYGFGKIKLEPLLEEKRDRDADYYYKEYLKDILVDAGFVEIFTYPFLSERDLSEAQIEAKDLLEVANPIQSENKHMRNSLVPGMLKTVAKNPAFDSVLVFELGNVFTKDSEESSLAVAASGKNAKKLIEDAVQKLAQASGLSKDDLAVSERSRDELQRFKIRKPITYTMEIKTAKLIEGLRREKVKLPLTIPAKKIVYRAISKYPSLTRDLAFVVDKAISTEDITETIYLQSDLVNRVELFDEYESDKLGKDKKSVAFHLDLSHLDKTLTDKEADEVINKAIKVIKDKFGAVLRSY